MTGLRYIWTQLINSQTKYSKDFTVFRQRFCRVKAQILCITDFKVGTEPTTIISSIGKAPIYALGCGVKYDNLILINRPSAWCLLKSIWMCSPLVLFVSLVRHSRSSWVSIPNSPAVKLSSSLPAMLTLSSLADWAAKSMLPTDKTPERIAIKSVCSWEWRQLRIDRKISSLMTWHNMKLCQMWTHKS